MTDEEIKLLSEHLDAALRSTDIWTLIKRGIEVVASWDDEKEAREE